MYSVVVTERGGCFMVMALLESAVVIRGQHNSHCPAYSVPVFSASALTAPASHTTLSTQRYAVGLTLDLCCLQRAYMSSRHKCVARQSLPCETMHHCPTGGPGSAHGPLRVCVCLRSNDKCRTK